MRNLEECNLNPEKGEVAVEVVEASDEDAVENKTHLSRDPSSAVWCREDQIEWPIMLTEGDADGRSASETEDWARERKQKPNFFRQRSSHSG